ncbi:30S ribosomal protein S4e [Nanoarchaeota archaeon]
MKDHLKRNFVPKNWPIKRKAARFLIRPKPSGHPMESGLPLAVILRDVLGHVQTLREVKKVLHDNDVLVDSKRRKDPKFLVGLFDVLSLPVVKEDYRLLFDKKGKLSLLAIDEKEAKIKVAKVIGKRALKKGKVQLNLHDGKNILSDDKIKVGDSVVLSLPDNKIQQVLPLKEKAQVYLVKGKRAGSSGVLKEISGNKAIYESGKEKIETLKDYIMVVGEDKPIIKLEK